MGRINKITPSLEKEIQEVKGQSTINAAPKQCAS
jgi:hypothetical protein